MRSETETTLPISQKRIARAHMHAHTHRHTERETERHRQMQKALKTFTYIEEWSNGVTGGGPQSESEGWERTHVIERVKIITGQHNIHKALHFCSNTWQVLIL